MSRASKFLKYIVVPIVAGIVVFFSTLPLAYRYGSSAGWEKGYQEGKQYGIEEGSKIGRKVGFEEGFEQGKEIGMKEGIEKGREHSMLKFMDVYKKHLDATAEAISWVEKEANPETLSILRSSVRATVEDVKVWRQIQEKFKELLDGQIDDLETALQRSDYRKLMEIIRILQQTYEGKRLAIETELAKSKI